MANKNRTVRKSIAIIGEGLTEYRYIDDMRTTERYRFSLVPGIPKHSDIDDIVRLARIRKRNGVDYVICLVDMDVILTNHDKMEHYKALQRENSELVFVESNPCTEYWFLMHYMLKPSSRDFKSYDVVSKELRKHIPNYDKTEEFFNKNKIYKLLKSKGTLERTIDLSRELDNLREKEPDVYKSYSQMYKLFDIIKEITG